jgi:hypothetical protein
MIIYKAIKNWVNCKCLTSGKEPNSTRIKDRSFFCYWTQAGPHRTLPNKLASSRDVRRSKQAMALISVSRRCWWWLSYVSFIVGLWSEIQQFSIYLHEHTIEIYIQNITFLGMYLFLNTNDNCRSWANIWHGILATRGTVRKLSITLALVLLFWPLRRLFIKILCWSSRFYGHKARAMNDTHIARPRCCIGEKWQDYKWVSTQHFCGWVGKCCGRDSRARMGGVGVATALIWGALEYMAVVTCAEFVATEGCSPGGG